MSQRQRTIVTEFGDFALLPAGEFRMGCDIPYTTMSGSARREHTHARHVHPVRITTGFAMLSTPLTCGAISNFVRDCPGLFSALSFRFKTYSYPEGDYALGDDIEHPAKTSEEVQLGAYLCAAANRDLPVHGANWWIADAFCAYASQKLGRMVRLPTEAEWEYACRAGTHTVYYFGNDTSQVIEHAWCCANSGIEPKPVGHFTPNPWGLYDIVGNVWEWCADGYSTTFYERSPLEDPQCVRSDKGAKVIRGGSSLNKAETCRSSHRYGLPPAVGDRFLGFRPVLELS